MKNFFEKIPGKILRPKTIFDGNVKCDRDKNTLKTLVKLPDWRQTTHNCRVMGSVRVY